MEELDKTIVAPKLLTDIREEVDIKENDGSIVIDTDVSSAYSYVLYVNKTHLVKRIVIRNTLDKDVYDLMIRLSSDNDIFEPYEVDVPTLSAKAIIAPIIRPELIFHAPIMLALNETTEFVLRVSVIYRGEEIAAHCDRVDLLACTEFPGFDVGDQRILASFVLPNNPAVECIRQEAAKYFNKFNGNPAFDGYQSKDPKRVVNMAAALYYAIQSMGIVYSNPPSSFNGRQKIRYPDIIVKDRFGTCMDMTLLYAACLENCGLHPILIYLEKHILAGVWLIDDQNISKEVSRDNSLIEKKTADGINEMLVVECTLMCSGQNADFKRAVEEALKKLKDVEYYVDVNLARIDKIPATPIPTNNDFDLGSIAEMAEDRSESVVAPSIDVSSVDVEAEVVQNKEMTKIDQWERKLLDMSLRNHLLNTRATSGVVPLLVKDLAELEKEFYAGKEYVLLGQPKDWTNHGLLVPTFESFGELYEYADVIYDAFMHQNIHSAFLEGALNTILKKQFKSCKLSIEETGVNTLYLALGLLRWNDYTKSSKQTYYAPIILVPIEFIKKPANRGYAIKRRDDETIINRTLLEFLKQQFALDITGLNPPPQGDNGVDVPKVLAIVRKAIMDRPEWLVLDAAFIANYSFAQFMMWNDVHSHSDELSKNKIVSSLVSGKLEWDPKVPEDIDNDEALLPVPVDASQLHAIKMAANGISFVLHGPPGTGKSQTITAMIANALSKGQKVLFVAEKKAALEVVYKRLKAIGIEEFCLELHSTKSTRRDVLEQLRKAVEIKVWELETDYGEKLESLKNMRIGLDEYVNELHRERECGMTVRELIDAYESIPEYDKRIRLDKERVIKISKKDLYQHQILLENLFSAGSVISSFKDHPLSAIKLTEYSQKLRVDSEDFQDDYNDALDSLERAAEILSDSLGVEYPVSYTNWCDLILLSGSIIGKRVDGMQLSGSSANDIVDKITAMKRANEEFVGFDSYFQSRYEYSVLDADLDKLESSYANAQKKIIGKQKAIDAAVAELQKYVKYTADYSKIGDIKTDVDKYRRLEAAQDEAIHAVGFIFDGRGNKLKEDAQSLYDAFTTISNMEAEFCSRLQIKLPDDVDNWLETRRGFVNSICDHSSELRDWIVYQSARSKCCDEGLASLCELYEEGFDKELIMPLYKKSVYKVLIRKYLASIPVLDGFSGNTFGANIEQYKRAETEYIALAKEELRYKLTHNLPVVRDGYDISKELTILRKAISSGGRNMSLRNLFDKIPNILTRLCPCLLMSPMSVAQFLDPSFEKFDLVIFDEASQMPTAQAVGSLARGINAVIVGDPKQLPPTGFFNGDLTDDENIHLEDMDSILDDCLALGMPDTHLMWHYRSKHESLIAFSNAKFYGSSMFTFPSVNDRERRVKLCTVNGRYLREKGPGKNTNPVEAQAIFKEVMRRYNSELLHDQTMGIVTFNIKQRDLIDDMIEEECKKDPDFDKWVHRGDEDYLFVKNLENVQGDERDVILFSITFGPDQNGRIYYNFGPLNQDGGWKRLNVAISRSKNEMIVFSSMTPDMMDVNRSNNDGIKYLHSFLNYAYTGVLDDAVEKENFQSKGITLQICKALENAGYKVSKNVGSSDAKIDVAVVNPYDEGEYLLGIMLDGDSYKNAGATRDREVAQRSVLGGLGWNTYRMWTMDWWDDKNREIGKLLKLLEELKVEAKKRAEDPSAKDPGPESEEIVVEAVPKEKKPRKKKMYGDGATSFEEYDRFTVKTEGISEKSEGTK